MAPESAVTSIICAVCALFLLPYFSTVPIWDGYAYAQCILSVPEYFWSIDAARCYGHPSMSYVWLMRLLQYLPIAALPTLYLTNIVLLIIAGVLMQKAVRVLHPTISFGESLIPTLLFICTPQVVVHIFHITPDLGVMAFGAMFLSLLLMEKFEAAGIAGFFLVFSKEIGAGFALLCIALLPVLLLKYWQGSRGFSKFVASLLQSSYAAIPVIVFGLYFLIMGGLWVGASHQGLMQSLFDTSLNTPSMEAYLFGIFGLHFRWVLTVFSLLAALLFMFRNDSISRSRFLHTVFLVLVLVFSAYLVTRYRPVNNARYVFVAMLPLFFLGHQSILYTFASFPIIRRMVGWGLVLLFFLSTFRTIDPVSMHFYGTVRFGEHLMLNTNYKGYANPYSRYGRDEVAYNLEYLDIARTLQSILYVLHPYFDSKMYANPHFLWALPRFDVETGVLTMSETDAPLPLWPLHSIDDLKVNSDSSEIYYLDYPMFDRPPLDVIQDADLKSTRILGEWDEYGVFLHKIESGKQ